MLFEEQPGDSGERPGVGEESFHRSAQAADRSLFQQPDAALGRARTDFLPAASRRSHSSRSRCTNGMAAHCRAAAALATGGPKSLINWLTVLSACW